MSEWLPCPLAMGYIAGAICFGYLAGTWREQLRLIEIIKPEK